MNLRRASDFFVECLEAEGVKYVFGIPGEETLDFNDSLDASSIRFIPVRHEQGGAYMADVYGRLTGNAGVCLGTLGPGATNLVTAVADAYLDRAPLVALTGQGDLERMHKESHQYIDITRIMQPVTKWNARLTDPAIIAEVVRKAFKLAEGEKPGPTHIEMPEDVMATEVTESSKPLTKSHREEPTPNAREILRAADIIGTAVNPVILAGNGVLRTRSAEALRQLVHSSGIPAATTFMGKGAIDGADPKALGTVGLQAGDYSLAGFDRADVVIAVGYDLVEHSPKYWNPARDKRIVYIDTLPAEIDEFFMPETELVGDIYHVLTMLSEECRQLDYQGGDMRLRELTQRTFETAGGDDSFPAQPPRVLCEVRDQLGPEDILISDVGLHKLWIGRIFPAHEPNTVIIANGLAGMGFALPAAVAAKLVHPEKKVVTISGDGGFLMNCQELETAVRLGTGMVNIVWTNKAYGSIVWKQQKKFGRTAGTDFENPDFVKLAESFGMPAWRCESIDDLSRYLKQALDQSKPSLIELPIDYSTDVAISKDLGVETVAT